MTDYPEEVLRGISTQNDIAKDGYVMAGAFRFDKDARSEDGFCELSVNWRDDEGALSTLLNQHKPYDESPQFKVGYCVLNRTVINLMLKQYIDAGHFGYERRPILEDKEKDIQANPYHGNLLLAGSLDNNERKNVQHALAAAAGFVVLRENTVTPQ